MSMTPLQSWATIILLFIGVIAFTVVLGELDSRFDRVLDLVRNRRERHSAQVKAAMRRHPAGRALAAEHAAPGLVTHIGEAPSVRASGRPHLVVLDGGRADGPRARSAKPQRPYDWNVDGI